MWLRNRSLAVRLGGSFAFIVGLSMLGTVLGLMQLRQIKGHLEEIVDDNSRKLALSQRMSESVHIVSRVTRSVVLLDDLSRRQTEFGKINEARRNYEAAQSELEKMPGSERGLVMRKAVAEAEAQARPLNNQVLELALADKDDEATELLLSQATPATLAWQEALDANIDFQEASTQQDAEAAHAAFRNALAFGAGFGVLSALVAAGLAWVSVRNLLRELGADPADLAQAARQVRDGDLTAVIALREGAAADSVMAAFRDMREQLVDVVGRVRGNAESVSTASAQIAQGNADLSQRTEEQASALQQTAATMEQLGTTARHNTDAARQADQLAQGAATVAQQGGQVVSEVVSTMKGIQDSSRRIAEIIGVIDGIAFQTNILALNAAVEAARAGEQGRGFAVVAGEVRTLAQRSAEAAKEIKSLINDSVERVDAGTALVDKAGQTMNEVVASIRRVTDIVAEISSASREQGQGVQQVGDAVGQMDQTTQQNAALVEESAAAAESLRQQAQALLQAVATFRLTRGA